MAHLVCPWWLGYLLASPLRRLTQDPRAILQPFVSPNMTVLEPGPGMGFFALELARLVGPGGRVIAVDLQPRMLDGLRRRAEKARLLDRIDLRQAVRDRMGVDDLAGRVDFVLAFAVVHELPNQRRFLTEAAAALAPGGRLLVAEPRGHVSEKDFQATLSTAEHTGLRVESRPEIWRSRSAVLRRA